MEKVQDHLTDSFFILPNLLVKDGTGQSRNGVLIKLCNGCAISWDDGALIQHCTSLRILPKVYNRNGTVGDF